MFWRFAIPTLAALAALTASPAARAADFSPPMPPPAREVSDNWYLRGFVGVGMTQANQIEYLRNPANSNDFSFDHSSISNSNFIGGGIGYEWNSWLRFDVTGEYRAKTQVNAVGHYTQSCTLGDGITPAGYCLDTYQGYVSSWVFLANSYVDLGTWWCLTPFVGAGIGTARNSMADFTDIGIPTGGTGFGRNTSEWHMAYALYAGLAFDVSKNLKVDLSYRYLNFGSITETVDCTAGCNPDSFKFGNLYSHDIMLGLRWTCCEAPQAPRYVDTPPLHSKG
jgi:opacity protein-like surface antigen